MNYKIAIVIISFLLAFLLVGYWFFFDSSKVEIQTLSTSAQIVNNIALERKENTDIMIVALEPEEKDTIGKLGDYYIKVNYQAQVVTIYSKDEQGNYTKPVKAMICSTGKATPKSGVYSIPTRWRWGELQGNVYGQYITMITGNILFHSVPYLRMEDPASLEYWEYDKLGTNVSLGCVRLKVEDAKWIYDNCPNGTEVEFYASSNPGPLGKPIVEKISSYPDNLKNWDPTDLDENNPWKKYFE